MRALWANRSPTEFSAFGPSPLSSTSGLSSPFFPQTGDPPSIRHEQIASLRIICRRNPSQVDEELRTQGGKLPGYHETDVHTKATTGSSYVALLRACAKNKDLYRGTKIHEDIVANGLMGKCSNALATMYARCGALAKAKVLLMTYRSRDVFSWTALIAGFVQEGRSRDALDCFEHMHQMNLAPDAVTFACILKACGSLGAAERGKQIHEKIAQRGLLANDIVLGTSLVDMYVKFGNLKTAARVLEELPSRDVFTWSSLILGYAQQGQAEQALNCFELMESEGLLPDAVTFACILKACGIIGAADKGERIHNEIARQGLLTKNIVLGTALVDMYAKCGVLAKARRVLDDLFSRDVIAWNALMAGHAQQGQSDEALICFNRMQHEGFYPNAVTFSCVLNAFSNLGQVDDGHMHFMIINSKHGSQTDVEHYACMVDLFGRAGCLEEAVGIIQEMPFPAHSAVWSGLLGACQKWGDYKVGRWAFKHALKVDARDGAAHVLMANIYAAAYMQGRLPSC